MDANLIGRISANELHGRDRQGETGSWRND